MKRMWYVVLATVAMSSTGVFAAQKGIPGDKNADGKVSKEEFLAAREKAAEKADKEFNRTAVEKLFAKKDANKDGFLTGDELKAPQKKKPAKKEE